MVTPAGRVTSGGSRNPLEAGAVDVGRSRRNVQAHLIDRVAIKGREHLKTDSGLVSHRDDVDIYGCMILAAISVRDAVEEAIVNAVGINVKSSVVLVWCVSEALTVIGNRNRSVAIWILMHFRDDERWPSGLMSFLRAKILTAVSSCVLAVSSFASGAAGANATIFSQIRAAAA